MSCLNNNMGFDESSIAVLHERGHYVHTFYERGHYYEFITHVFLL